MARRPVHLAAAGKRPVSRDAIWSAVRRLVQFTVPQLAGETNMHRDTIKSYVAGLEAAGYVRRVGLQESRSGAYGVKGGAPFPAIAYLLVRDVGVEAPRVRRNGTEVRQGGARDQMWRAMKMIGEFSTRDLAVHASTEATPVSEVDAQDYVKHLARAGYLAVVRPGKPGTQATYRFLKSRNTGPRAPMVQRVKTVWDPNLGETVWAQEPSL
ncbi:hypothetical protein SAMN06265365_1603 [Tistlia consotensis]|nr:hypothetical protein [Tistlia consotensis]SNS38714.1 hypothetical protein SAMN06265365_1603 [Tistlia consotensis]